MSGDFVRLSEIFSASRRDDSVVAFGAGEDRCWSEFRADVGALQRRLLQEKRARRWLMFSDDAYAFSVALFAVVGTGGVSVLPANGQVGTLERLAADVDGMILDDGVLPAALADATRVLTPFQPQESSVPDLQDIEPTRDFVEFLTSGSSGEAKRISKELRHLGDEVAVLERTFGEEVGASRIFGTVSCQHIYGALFRVLWPLAAGRPFSRRTYLHGSEVASGMANVESVLITSPPQLKAMVAAGSLRDVSPRLIVSSGAPLDARCAAAVATMTGSAVTEVFGSTETGGVACRRRPDGGDVAWRPHAEVDTVTDRSGALAVTSPFVSVGDEVSGGYRRFVMGDRVEFDGQGGFHLRGRVDRIVKIGGKRLSLPEMEAEIVNSDLVAEAALVAMRRGGEVRVCAALVLSEEGARLVRERERSGLTNALSQRLAPLYDRVLLPRAWRIVDSLPRNAQGKLPAAALEDLFRDDAGGGSRDPVLASESRRQRSLARECRVPADLAYCDGHFDGFPIVPGVVHLRWVLSALTELIGCEPVVREIQALKFKQPLRPGMSFELTVEIDEDQQRARFRLNRGAAEVSSGRLRLG